MRCRSCDRNLNDYESTRRSISTGEYIDLCNRCYREVKDEIVALGRPDLEDVIDEIELERNKESVDINLDSCYGDGSLVDWSER